MTPLVSTWVQNKCFKSLLKLISIVPMLLLSLGSFQRLRTLNKVPINMTIPNIVSITNTVAMAHNLNDTAKRRCDNWRNAIDKH